MRHEMVPAGWSCSLMGAGKGKRLNVQSLYHFSSFFLCRGYSSLLGIGKNS